MNTTATYLSVIYNTPKKTTRPESIYLSTMKPIIPSQINPCVARPAAALKSTVEWEGSVGEVRVRGRRSYLHALAELADLAVDDVTLFLRYIRLFQHPRRFRDLLLCKFQIFDLRPVL